MFAGRHCTALVAAHAAAIFAPHYYSLPPPALHLSRYRFAHIPHNACHWIHYLHTCQPCHAGFRLPLFSRHWIFACLLLRCWILPRTAGLGRAATSRSACLRYVLRICARLGLHLYTAPFPRSAIRLQLYRMVIIHLPDYRRHCGSRHGFTCTAGAFRLRRASSALPPLWMPPDGICCACSAFDLAAPGFALPRLAACLFTCLSSSRPSASPAFLFFARDVLSTRIPRNALARRAVWI